MISWRPRAWQALEAQASWLLEEAGLDVAERFLDEVQSTIDLVERNPELGRLWEDPPAALAGLRWTVVGGFRSHLLFYKSVRAGVEIVHVLHGARDIGAALEGAP